MGASFNPDLDVLADEMGSMASSDFEILVAQARNEADTPSLKVCLPEAHARKAVD